MAEIGNQLSIDRTPDVSAIPLSTHHLSLRLWSLLMLQFWFREFTDGESGDAPAEYAPLRVA